MMSSTLLIRLVSVLLKQLDGSGGFWGGFFQLKEILVSQKLRVVISETIYDGRRGDHRHV